MSAVAAAVIGGVATLGGGLIAAGGAKKAANIQAEASREARATDERMLERQIGLQEPFRQAGLTAQEQIMQLLGVGGDASAAGRAHRSRWEFSPGPGQSDIARGDSPSRGP